MKNLYNQHNDNNNDDDEDNKNKNDEEKKRGGVVSTVRVKIITKCWSKLLLACLLVVNSVELKVLHITKKISIKHMTIWG